MSGRGVIDKEAIRHKYLEERDKRLRADGNEQYLQLKGRLSHYVEDPHTPVTPREKRTDHVTFAFIGGGFGGLVTGARLAEAGIQDVRILEKGGDFGGTWYWNRYPGAQCDTASMIYMPLLEETGHIPKEKYAHGPEILEHCRRIGRQFGLYENALFHTEVTALEWDAARSVWRIRTNRGDAFTARFIALGTGNLHVPKLPGIPGLESFEDSDYEKMEEIRARAEAIVQDPETAEKLKPWYRQLCKRPCFHDEYLQAFNSPNTRLIDTDGKGVERITETGFVVGGALYPVDCIIYASGFEIGTDYTRRAGFDLVGRGGVTLSDHWAEGMRTKHGIHAHGFPNAFFVQATQGANLIPNIPHNLTEAGKTIAMIVRHARDAGAREVEVTKEAEDAWIALLLTGAGRVLGSPDCTPGYFNNEGQDPGPRGKLNVGYPAGAMAYFRYLDEWRRSGAFEGLEFRV